MFSKWSQTFLNDLKVSHNFLNVLKFDLHQIISAKLNIIFSNTIFSPLVFFIFSSKMFFQCSFSCLLQLVIQSSSTWLTTPTVETTAASLLTPCPPAHVCLSIWPCLKLISKRRQKQRTATTRPQLGQLTPPKPPRQILGWPNISHMVALV